MATLDRAVLSLRVAGDDLRPEDITALLGIEPSVAYAKGEELRSEHGPSRLAQLGHWSVEAPTTSPADLDAQIMNLLSRLSDDLAAWRSLQERFRVDLFFGWFMEVSNEGTSINSVTLKTLAERGIDISFDIYGPADKLGPDHAQRAAGGAPDRDGRSMAPS